MLLDAPCSSTGTLRKHPDVSWTKDADDIAKLAALQEQMLRHAATLIVPGGIVVFSNCSLDPLEGEEMVERVLATSAELERLPADARDFEGLECCLTEKGELRTTPDLFGGIDGFYACALRRRKS